MDDDTPCEICKQYKKGCERGPQADPYIAEIDDLVVLRVLCDDCWQERKDDI